MSLIIDCHGHYTTAPKALENWRNAQIAGIKDPAAMPKVADLKISDDELRESIETNQLKLMKERGSDITLFSPSDVPGLYDAFFADQDEFERLYTQYEQDDSIRKQRIKAVELFSLMMQERASTGRIYIQNVDHCNTHSPFDPQIAPVRQSNLCLEIALPTKPLEDVNDENGEIALCTLSAFNLGAIDSLDDLEELATLAVRSLDALLDYQDYPIKAAHRGAMGRRTLGIGRADLVLLVAVRTAAPAVLGAVVGAGTGYAVVVGQGGALGLDFVAGVAVLAALTAVVASLLPAAFAAFRDPVRVMRTA